jgi:hypothetical protein
MMEIAQFAQFAAIIGLSISMGVLVFKAGGWKTEMEEQHEEIESAHQSMHKDIQSISEEINGEVQTNYNTCEICSEN